jgi:hypothetical protein
VECGYQTKKKKAEQEKEHDETKAKKAEAQTQDDEAKKLGQDAYNIEQYNNQNKS